MEIPIPILAFNCVSTFRSSGHSFRTWNERGREEIANFSKIYMITFHKLFLVLKFEIFGIKLMSNRYIQRSEYLIGYNLDNFLFFNTKLDFV